MKISHTFMLICGLPMSLMAQVLDTTTLITTESSKPNINEVISSMTFVSNDAEIEKLLNAINLDVLKYYGLRGEYDTELKEKIFKESAEYAKKISSLKAKKQEILDSSSKYYYHAPLRNFMNEEVVEYSVKNGGFLLHFQNHEVGNSHTVPMIGGILVPQLMGAFGECRACSENTVLIPVSESKGVLLEDAEKDAKEFEDDSKWVQLYLLFGIEGISNTTDDLKLIANNTQILLVNGITGEVYSSQLFKSGVAPILPKEMIDLTKKIEAQSSDVTLPNNMRDGSVGNPDWGMGKEETKKWMQRYSLVGESDAGLVFTLYKDLIAICGISNNRLQSVVLKFSKPEGIISKAVQKLMANAQSVGIQELGESGKMSKEQIRVLKAENYLFEIQKFQDALVSEYGPGKQIPNAVIDTPYGKFPAIKTIWDVGNTRITSQYIKPGSTELQNTVNKLNPNRNAILSKRLGGEFAIALGMFVATYSIEYHDKMPLVTKKDFKQVKKVGVQPKK